MMLSYTGILVLGFYVLLSSEWFIKNGVKCQVVKIFDKPHFYEFFTKKAAAEPDFFQDYDYYIDNEVECVAGERVIFNDELNEAGNRLDLESEPVIYRNNQSTMSFIMNIQFNRLIIENSDSFYGYELKFENQENQKSCFQIMTLHDRTDNDEKKIVINIKDPAFISLKNINYTFYYGRITLSVIMKCPKGYCLSQISEGTQVGIESKKNDTDTSQHFKHDFSCNRSLAAQACVQDYKTRNNIEFYIIHQPFPGEFREMEGYFDLIDEDSSIHFPYHSYEKWPNDLAIKIIPKQMPDIFYAAYPVELEESYQNKMYCHNSTLDRFCPCNEADFCPVGLTNSREDNFYSEEQTVSPCLESYKDRIISRIAPLFSIKNRNNCMRGFFEAYSYNGIKYAENFQRQSFGKTVPRAIKRDPRENETMSLRRITPNRDFLPRISLSVDLGSASSSKEEKYIDVRVKFVDVLKTAAPNKARKFQFNLYSNAIYECRSLENKYVKSFSKLVSLHERVYLKALIVGKSYMVELIPLSDSSLCPPNLCVDEGLKNNEIQCVPCVKAVMHLKTWKKSQSNEHLNYRSNIEYSYYSENFQNELFSSYFDKPEHQRFHFNPPFVLVESSTALDQKKWLKLVELSWGILPASYDISNLKFPVVATPCRIIEQTNNGLINIAAVAAILFIAFAILLSCPIVFYRSKLYLVNEMNVKTVSFYLSKNLEGDQLATQNRLAEVIRRSFLRWFPHMRFNIISEQVPQQEIERCLLESDMIVYICASISELNFVMDVDAEDVQKCLRQLRIGQQSHHHNFHRIHFIPKYSSKRLSILLNRDNFGESVRVILYAILLSKSNNFYLNPSFNYEYYRAASTGWPPYLTNEFCLTYLLRRAKFKFKKLHFNALLSYFLSTVENDFKRTRRRSEFQKFALVCTESSQDFALKFEDLPREVIAFKDV